MKIKKRFIIGAVLLLTLLMMTLVMCGEEEEPKGSVKSITITVNGRHEAGIRLYQGTPLTLAAEVQTENGAGNGVTWYIENKAQPGTQFININGNNATFIIDYDEYTLNTKPDDPLILTIIARSTFDTKKFAQLFVTIRVREPRLAVPSNLVLNAQGDISWTPVSDSGISEYSLQLYKDGDKYGEPETIDKYLSSHSLRDKMRSAGHGVYNVTLKAIGNAPSTPLPSETPAGIVFNSKPSALSNERRVILPKVTELIWYESGSARWKNLDTRENQIAQQYEVKLFKDGNTAPIHTVMVNNKSYDEPQINYNFAFGRDPESPAKPEDKSVPAEAGVRYWFTVKPILRPGLNDPLMLPEEESSTSNRSPYSALGGNIDVNLEKPDDNPSKVNAIIKGTVNSNTIYVAGSANGRMAWSTDGRIWNYAASATAVFVADSVNAIAFGNGRFLAVGDRGKMAYSDDGKEWKLSPSFTTTGRNLTAVTYAFGKFFVGGEDGLMRHSTTGISAWGNIAGSGVDKNNNLFEGASSIRAILASNTHPSGPMILAFCTRARVARAVGTAGATSFSGTSGWEQINTITNGGSNSRNLRRGAVREDGYIVLILQEEGGWSPYSATRGNTGWVWAQHGAGSGVQTITYGGGRFYLGSTQGRLTIYTPSISTITGAAANPATPGGTWQAIPVGLEPGQTLFTREETITALCLMDSGDLIMAGPGKFTVRPAVTTVIPPPSTAVIGIKSSYENVDWQKHIQYKAGIHSHTNRSDGANTVSQMIEDHYTKGYDIYAITDHNVVNSDWTTPHRVSYGTDTPITQQRYEEISRGEGRNNRKMTRIPFTNEQSRVDHFNTYFANWNNPGSGATLYNSIMSAQQVGGISHFNHPGREIYEIRDTVFEPDNVAFEMVNQSTYISKYVGHFFEFESLIGMEIVNQRDRYKFDRIIYDNVLKQTMPVGRFVWAFCNDDSHALGMTGFSYNVLIMPENNLANIKSALINGNFYGIARVLRRELGANFSGQGEPPVIRNIAVDNNNMTISITAQNAESIVWIADGEEIQKGGNSDTLRVRSYPGKINSYVRAYITGKGGVAFTQPFRILYN